MDTKEGRTMISFDNIIFEGKRRYYIEDLTQRDYSLENTTPYTFEILGNVIEEHAWGELLRATTMTLLESFPGFEEKLYSFRCPWSKAVMFKPDVGTNYKLVSSKIYINCNHTALHSCWFLQDLLDFFNVDKSQVKLVIHRSPAAEPKEVKEYIEKRFKKDFVNFLELAYGKDAEYAQKVLDNIDKYLNPRLAKMSKSYNSFFLFDDVPTFSNYAKKVKEVVYKDFQTNEKALKVLNKYIKYLIEFYKI